jgi:hypothetical protein
MKKFFDVRNAAVFAKVMLYKIVLIFLYYKNLLFFLLTQTITQINAATLPQFKNP